MTTPIYKFRTVVRRFTKPTHNPNIVTQHEEIECGHIIRARGPLSLEITNEKRIRRQCFECGRVTPWTCPKSHFGIADCLICGLKACEQPDFPAEVPERFKHAEPTQ